MFQKKSETRIKITVPSHSKMDFERVAEKCALLGVEIDHFHGVIKDGDEVVHIIHLDEMGNPQGPQTAMKAEWMPRDFDEISADGGN